MHKIRLEEKLFAAFNSLDALNAMSHKLNSATF